MPRKKAGPLRRFDAANAPEAQLSSGASHIPAEPGCSDGFLMAWRPGMADSANRHETASIARSKSVDELV
jgi:hypothetical protein